MSNIAWAAIIVNTFAWALLCFLAIIISRGRKRDRQMAQDDERRYQMEREAKEHAENERCARQDGDQTPSA